jgi:hypothetical protein
MTLRVPENFPSWLVYRALVSEDTEPPRDPNDDDDDAEDEEDEEDEDRRDEPPIIREPDE